VYLSAVPALVNAYALFTFKPSFDSMLINGEPIDADGKVVVKKSNLCMEAAGSSLGLVEREIEIAEGFSVIISEQQPEIDEYLERKTIVDPFGTILWPGAIAGCRVLRKMNLEKGTRVMVLGCGVGLEVKAVSQLGLIPIAVDYNKELFELLVYDGVETVCLDLTSDDELPMSDVVMACDCLYSEATASALAVRLGKMIEEGRKVLVTDSQRFHSKLFLELLNDELDRFGKEGGLRWRKIDLKGVRVRGVTDSGVRDSDITVNLLTA